ncbi:MAG: hypothetical protein N2505_06740, partial [Endomicrobia bacterium]|nr:hypothetical protein [Endomicrobiia bacterium]
YQADNFKNITFFTMGKISLISRSMAVLLNMPLVYVATKKPVISTQPHLKQIINILSKMGLI